MRKTFYGAFLALTPLCATAQTAIVGNVKVAGSPVTVGTLSITPVNVTGQPIPFSDGAGTQYSKDPIVCQLASGAVSAGCSVPDSQATIPAGLLYTFQYCDTSTVLRTSGKCTTLQMVPGVTGSSWNIGTYGPPINAQSQLQALMGPVTPPKCSFPSFFHNTTTGEEKRCNPSTGQYETFGIQGQQGAPGPAPAIAVNNVQTLAPGAAAVVAVDPSSTSSSIKLNFGIPQGAAGTGGGSSTPIPVLADTSNGNSYAVTTVAGRMHVAQTSSSSTASSVALPGGGTLTVTNGRLHISQ